MKFYSWIIRYRLPLGIVLILGAIAANVYAGFWPAFPLYFVGLILILSHFLIGPLRLVQEYMEAGDIEGAQRIVNSVKFPGLLIKPVRSAYFTIKGQLEMANQNFDAAEASMKKGMSLTTKMTADMKGANFLQMGMISLQKGDFKQGEKYIREALRAGINDKESEAVAYLQMCNIMMNKREFRAAKEFFRKTKALKPTNPEVVGQIKEIEKYIARIPG